MAFGWGGLWVACFGLVFVKLYSPFHFGSGFTLLAACRTSLLEQLVELLLVRHASYRRVVLSRFYGIVLSGFYVVRDWGVGC